MCGVRAFLFVDPLVWLGLGWLVEQKLRHHVASPVTLSTLSVVPWQE